jgi:hypothetical protein
MTLILTELTSFGIAMAADSAVKVINTRTGLAQIVPGVARKLQQVPYLNAGISCWGEGEIENTPTDQWLSAFIASNQGIDNLHDFAGELASQLNDRIPSPPRGNRCLGFHLAGFDDFNGTPTPSFYHIHDGFCRTLESRGIYVDATRFNANHNVPPDIFVQNPAYLIRNGDIRFHAEIFASLESVFTHLRPIGVLIPHSQDLEDRASYLIFQIKTVAEIYRLSNLLPGIGGQIHYLTINPQGYHSKGIRYF